MATKQKLAPERDILKEEVLISEAYLCGLFFNKPELFSYYSTEKIGAKTFLNEDWGFFFGLSRYIAEKGVEIIDDITMTNYVNELKLEKKYEKYGGFEKIKEVADEVIGKEDNLDAYYEEIKRYRQIYALREFLGDKVIKPDGKYDYHKMTKDQIFTYWNDKMNQIGLDGDARYEEHDLLDLDKSIEEWDMNPAVGLPFYNSKEMTKICVGWDFGNLYLYGGFGGSGKTSITVNKIIMSCIQNNEKLLVIANEQGIEEWRKALIITVIGILRQKRYREIKEKLRQEGEEIKFNRKRINEGEFSVDEKQLLYDAKNYVKQLVGEGNKGLIKLVFMEDYIMDDVKKIVRYYANRGYKSVIVDTGKPSEGTSGQKARWEIFTDDFKDLYKLVRPNGGGLNLRMWVNVQLADTALKSRFLDEHAFGESKKIKNEASVVFMGRFAWADEYEGESNELTVKNWVKTDKEKNPFVETDYMEIEKKLDKKKKYYLLFTPKNRRGLDNKMGQDVLVFEVNLNYNYWREVGLTTVYNDRNY